MKMIVSFLASKEEKQELMQIFQYLDSDNDGKLSNEELINGMKKVMDHEEATLEGNRIITQFDKRKTFGLDYSSK